MLEQLPPIDQSTKEIIKVLRGVFQVSTCIAGVIEHRARLNCANHRSNQNPPVQNPQTSMSWLGRFSRQLGLGGTNSNSREVARERLSIILAHQRGEVLLDGIDLKRLQQEVLQCVKVRSLSHFSRKNFDWV